MPQPKDPKKYSLWIKRLKKSHRHSQTKETAEKISKTRKERILSGLIKYKYGNEHAGWKENPNYAALHGWLSNNFEKSTKCELCNSSKKMFKNNRPSIEWALKKGCEYERKRENFICICRKCHLIYDQVGNHKNKKIIKLI